MIYLIGSLRNPKIPLLGVELRKLGYEVFDDWYGAGHEADDKWREYEQVRGRRYAEALYGHAAVNAFSFDDTHLQRATAGILVLPAGKSGHLELGYMIGLGKRGYVLFEEEPERWDLMYHFADGVAFSPDDLFEQLQNGENGEE